MIVDRATPRDVEHLNFSEIGKRASHAPKQRRDVGLSTPNRIGLGEVEASPLVARVGRPNSLPEARPKPIYRSGA